MKYSIILTLVVIGSALLLAPPLAAEERSFPLERLRLSMDDGGVITAEAGRVLEHLQWQAALWLGYADDPLVLVDRDSGERQATLVDSRLGAQLQGALGLLGWLEVGLELPLILHQAEGGESAAVNPGLGGLTSAGLGDLRVAPKLGLLRAADFGIDVAVIAGATLPSASADAFFGESSLTFAPEIALSRVFGDLRAAANIGLRLRSKTRTSNLRVDDELFFHLGAAYRLHEAAGVPLQLAVGLSGAGGISAGLFARRNQSPLEAMGAVSYALLDILELTTGGGAGLVPGYGTPDWRCFVGARLRSAIPPPPAPQDSDSDGLLDDVDRCPNDPEDIDGHEDTDGCPDPDNDNDQIPDVDDQCPGKAETVNGFADEDGCPDDLPDSDDDGLADSIDQCPEDPEDRDQFADQDGCPDLDNDADGLFDGSDRCPQEVGPQENGGCPDTDKDGDSVVDRLDNCPNEPGPASNQGCIEEQKVKLTDEKIEILEKVFFASGKALIEERSHALLDNIARVLVAHPEIARVRIEGHTDSRGPAEYNKNLSQLRAEAVRDYLLGKGIAAERLEAIGWGEEHPIASNRSSRGRETNRRVEFNLSSE